MKANLILILMIGILKGSHHDYEISRGMKMWSGKNHAIHYFDHFLLLNTQMRKI